ncbi:hypothetical protein FBZ89_14217 [Nitrospirillum amazonense]|uniref:Uncharacterized protein n=1 Tax=Nitrospirillum amazonense TaxID=28077 RepID=A0A560EIY2_9PROT|nr:hypothetical protein [Nitrospirillum amazonense]TWB09333.1 hypothetical protein FBZ89_14217 [Nitrospirillum amazonense]
MSINTRLISTMVLIVCNMLFHSAFAQSNVEGNGRYFTESTIQVGMSLLDYRKKIVADDTFSSTNALWDQIYGKEHLENREQEIAGRAAGRFFMVGAIPIVLTNNMAALYNPFSDIFLLYSYKKDTDRNEFSVTDVYAGGGDSLAKYSGIKENYTGDDLSHLVKIDIKDRVRSRFSLLVKATSHKDFMSLAKELSKIENRDWLLGRYVFSIASGPLRGDEQHAINTIFNSFNRGDALLLYNDPLISIEDHSEFDKIINELHKVEPQLYSISFLTKSGDKSTVHFSPIDNPSAVFIVRMHRDNERISIDRIGFIGLNDLKPGK